MFLITSIAMLIIRWWTGCKIAHEVDRETESRSSDTMRFNIKSLFVWTAFWAGLLAIGRYSWPFVKPFRMGSMEEVILGVCIFVLVFGPLVFVALSLLSERLFSALVVSTIIGWPIAVFAAVALLAFVEPNAPDTFEVFILVTCGGALLCCLTVLPLRLAGYRLRVAPSK
jgi:hypothetical protein